MTVDSTVADIHARLSEDGIDVTVDSTVADIQA